MNGIFFSKFLTLFYLTQQIQSKLDIKIFENTDAFIFGFLHKKISDSTLKSLPIIFSRIDIKVQKNLCLKFGYDDIFALSYPKKLNTEEEYFTMNCSSKSCN